MKDRTFLQLLFRPLVSYQMLSVVGLALFFSSFTLWLVESQMKYPLFVFEAFVIIAIYYLLNESDHTKYYKSKFDIQNRIKAIALGAEFLGFSFDILLVTASSILILLNELQAGAGIIQLSLALISTSVLSGYSLLNIFNVSKYFSKLEVVVLSYLLSFIFSGFCTLSLLSVDENTRSVLIPIFFISLGTVSAALRYFRHKHPIFVVKEEKRPNSLSRNLDITAIVLSVFFYVLFFYYMYPNLALLPSTDVSMHYNYSLILSRTPDLYTGFYYILFHSFEATLHTSSGVHQTLASFQTFQIILNIFLPLTIYVFAKRFLHDVDKRIPALSTIFYSVLSNFSFIYFAQLKLLGGSGLGEIQILGLDVAEKAYNGTINFLQPFHFFVPISVSIIMFMMAFLLLKVRAIPRSIFVPLYAVLILAMYLTHVTESVIFVTFIGIYSIIFRSKGVLRLDDALLSSLIALVVAIMFFSYASVAWNSTITKPNFFYSSISDSILASILVGISMLLRWKVSPRIHLSINFVNSKKFYPILSVSLAIIYLLGFLTWFFIEDFKTSSVLQIGVTPWFVYPLMMGIIGLLAILSIRYLNDILPNNSITILLSSIVFLLLIGKVVSLVNLYFITTGYWEKRFLSLIFIFACLLAPISLIKFKEQLPRLVKRKLLARNSFLMCFISLILISGFSSMVLQYEYWFAVANSDSYGISNKEIQAVTYLKSILEHDPYAFTMTPSKLSHDVLAFAAPGYQVSLPEALLFSKYADVPLLTLAAYNLKHAYIYMDSRDFELLKEQETHQSYLKHLLPFLPVIFSNGEVTIYNATHVSFPLSNSDTTMVIPSDPHIVADNSWFYAYDTISQSGKNYTVMYDTDPNALKSKTVILSFDPTQYYSYHSKFGHPSFKLSNYSMNVVSGIWNYFSDGLHGGFGTRGNNIPNGIGAILSPVSSMNFNASTSFRINSISSHAPNYVSVIHSWINPQNYQYAGITILNDKDVYVSSTIVNNGKISVYPSWPGIKTNLVWKPGDLFNLTLITTKSHKDTEEQLFLNGTKYYLPPIIPPTSSGYLGLSYSRTQDVVFDHYNIRELSKLNLRPLSDYITYVKSGGHLIVLNTNGNGSIANSLSSTTFSLDQPSRATTIETRKVLPITPFSSLNPNTTSTYTVEKNVVPLNLYSLVAQRKTASILATDATLGQGKITYINIYPIVSNYFQNKTSAVMAYASLGEMSRMILIKSKDPMPTNVKHIFEDHVATFREMNSTGNSKIITSSVIFPKEVELMRVSTINNQSISLANISNLHIEGYRSAILSSYHNRDDIILADGEGLYANLTFSKNNNDPFLNLSFSDNKDARTATVAATSNDGKPIRLAGVHSMDIISKEPITVYVRQPLLTINNGNTTLKGLYFGQIAGNDVRVFGNLSLSVVMSDAYTFMNRMVIDGSSHIVQPLSSYNEGSSLLTSFSFHKLYSLPPLVRALLLIPFLVAAIFFLFIPTKIKSNSRLKQDGV